MEDLHLIIHKVDISLTKTYTYNKGVNSYRGMEHSNQQNIRTSQLESSKLLTL